VTRNFASDPGDEQQYQDAADEVAVQDDGDGKDQTAAVLNRLEDRLGAAAGPRERSEALDAAGQVLVNVADRSDRDDVLYQIRQGASGVSGGAVNTISSDEIRDELLDPVLASASVDDGAGDSSNVTLENGVALDEFLEDYLEVIERLENTDHVNNDTRYRFSFSDGTVVETTDEHQLQTEFWRLLDTASNVELKPDTIGDAIADSDDPPVGDFTEQGSSQRKMLKRLSPGPDSRTWLSSEWQDCITNVMAEETETVKQAEKHVGPRTDAWTTLRRKVSETRGVRDLHDALDNGIVYVHTRGDGTEELWIPTKMADAACEDYATDRQGLAVEINDRGAGSAEVSGGGVSFETSRTSPPSYWWRVELSHPEVLRPGSVVDELDDDDEMWTGGDSVGESAAFGGDA